MLAGPPSLGCHWWLSPLHCTLSCSLVLLAPLTLVVISSLPLVIVISPPPSCVSPGLVVPVMLLQFVWSWSWSWCLLSCVHHCPGPPHCCPAIAGVHHHCPPFHHHQHHSTCHPPHKQLLIGLEVGGVMCGQCWCQHQWWHCHCIVVAGPWCSFIMVVSACHHPLTLPNLQAHLAAVEWVAGFLWWACLLVYHDLSHPIIWSYTHSHPMSSCSQQWSWVLSWLC